MDWAIELKVSTEMTSMIRMQVSQVHVALVFYSRGLNFWFLYVRMSRDCDEKADSFVHGCVPSSLIHYCVGRQPC